jgi:hypothetical protein
VVEAKADSRYGRKAIKPMTQAVCALMVPTGVLLGYHLAHRAQGTLFAARDIREVVQAQR